MRVRARPGRGAAGLLLVACLLAATACDATEPDAAPSPTPPPTPATEQEPRVEGLAVAVVLAPPDARFDALHNGPARLGIEFARRNPELARGGVRELAPPSTSFRRDLLEAAADGGAQLVCAVGERSEDDLLAVATEFPNTRFCLIGGRVDEPPANVVAFGWRGEEAGFLAGVAAAHATRSNTIGMLVGTATPTAERHRAGFEAGARHVRPDVRVRVVSAERREGDEGERDATLRAFDVLSAPMVIELEGEVEPGADVVYLLGGAAGTDVDDAARERGIRLVRWGPATEVDRDEVTPTPSPPPPPPPSPDEEGDPPPPVVEPRLGWIVPMTGAALQEAIRRALEGWQGGQEWLGVTAMTWLPGDGEVAASVAERVALLVEQIENGQVSVPEPPD